jgi:methylenetetrahydrofolate reductase (NADPH)
MLFTLKATMRFSDYFKDNDKPVISFELYPPKTEQGLQTLKKKIIPNLVKLGPSYITVTYGAGGSTQGSTLEIASTIKNECGLESACHLTCVGASSSEIDEVVRKIAAEGIGNIVVLRGDAPQGQGNFIAHDDGFSYANELVSHIRSNEDSAQRFGLAVAGYPEKHQEAESLGVDIANLKRKVDAGADIIITQLFYDNQAFFTYRDKVHAAGIDIPIVPGLMPIQSSSQIQRIAALCGARLPDDLLGRLEDAGDNDEMATEIGTKQCIAQSKELLDNGVPGIHFYVLNRSPQITRIVKALRV